MAIQATGAFLLPKARLCDVVWFRWQSFPSAVAGRSLAPSESRTQIHRRNFSSQWKGDKDLNDGKNRLDYHHSFHAGNFADVVKHVILVMLIKHMQKKNKPISYVETHAGAGLYSLLLDEKEYETEYQRGVFRLLSQLKSQSNHHLPGPVATYLDVVQSFQDSSSAALGGLVYPGSPLFAASLLKEQNLGGGSHSMLLYEKAPLVRQQLKTHLDRIGNGIEIETRCHNGYIELAKHAQSTSSLPARALILIDPPYQYGSDTEQIVALCAALNRHWRSARIAIWHPVRADHADKLQRLYQLLRKSIINAEILAVEASPPPAAMEGRKQDVGTGMVLIQPPFGMEQECHDDVLPKLMQMLYPGKEEDSANSGKATICVKWL